MRLLLFATLCTPLCAQLTLPAIPSKPVPQFMAKPRPMIQPFIGTMPESPVILTKPIIQTAPGSTTCSTPLLIVPPGPTDQAMPTIVPGASKSRGVRVIVPAPSCADRPVK